jgi:hypothetical protein
MRFSRVEVDQLDVIGLLTLHPEDRVLFEQLLTACVAPADVRAHVLDAIPPIVDPPGEEERLIAAIRSGEYVIALPPEEETAGGEGEAQEEAVYGDPSATPG